VNIFLNIFRKRSREIFWLINLTSDSLKRRIKFIENIFFSYDEKFSIKFLLKTKHKPNANEHNDWIRISRSFLIDSLRICEINLKKKKIWFLSNLFVLHMKLNFQSKSMHKRLLNNSQSMCIKGLVHQYEFEMKMNSIDKRKNQKKIFSFIYIF
jgi:hypothetical protein